MNTAVLLDCQPESYKNVWGEGRYWVFVISSRTTSCSIWRRSPTFWKYYVSVKSGSNMLCRKALAQKGLLCRWWWWICYVSIGFYVMCITDTLPCRVQHTTHDVLLVHEAIITLNCSQIFNYVIEMFVRNPEKMVFFTDDRLVSKRLILASNQQLKHQVPSDLAN
jgi:hypothetical protein